MPGDADVSAVAALLAEPGRAKILFALADGRALAASVLAQEAGVAPSTASGHLGKLVEAGMLDVRREGRHRYYEITSGDVVRALEALAQLAPPEPIHSLREHTRARAIRDARLCYDHVAGRLGVALMEAFIERGWIIGGDGRHHPERAGADRLSAPGHDVDYRLTEPGARALEELGVDIPALVSARRPLVRYCLDWSEQRHHLAGGLGAGVAQALLDRGWVQRAPRGRALTVTGAGRDGLRTALGVALEDARRAAA